MRTHAARVEAARGWAAMARDLNSPSRSLHREDLIDDRTRRLGRLHGPQLGDRVCTRWLANARRNLLGGLVAKNFQGHQGTVPLLALPCARKGCESNSEQGFDTKGAISADSSEKARCATMFRGRGRMGAREFDFMSAHPCVEDVFAADTPVSRVGTRVAFGCFVGHLGIGCAQRSASGVSGKLWQAGKVEEYLVGKAHMEGRDI